MKQPNVRGVGHIAAALPGMAVSATTEDVRIRPYGVTDRDRLVRMSDHVSRASLYTRFFSGTPRIPDYHLQSMDRLDHWDREAMVALLTGEIIGIAEYTRDSERPWQAEIAALVADPWQRQGLARLLVGGLAELAARRGITEFGADVIVTNQVAVHAIHSGWPAAHPRTEDGAARFRLPLPVPASA